MFIYLYLYNKYIKPLTLWTNYQNIADGHRNRVQLGGKEEHFARIDRMGCREKAGILTTEKRKSIKHSIFILFITHFLVDYAMIYSLSNYEIIHSTNSITRVFVCVCVHVSNGAQYYSITDIFTC